MMSKDAIVWSILCVVSTCFAIIFFKLNEKKKRYIARLKEKNVVLQMKINRLDLDVFPNIKIYKYVPPEKHKEFFSAINLLLEEYESESHSKMNMVLRFGAGLCDVISYIADNEPDVYEWFYSDPTTFTKIKDVADIALTLDDLNDELFKEDKD